jgi:hypothetical protein
MDAIPTKTSLSSARIGLLLVMQRYPFCRIENLSVCGGEPKFDTATRVIQEIKLGADNSARPELEKQDYKLKASVISLFEHIEQIGNGRVAFIEVRCGLPVRLTVEQPLARALGN